MKTIIFVLSVFALTACGQAPGVGSVSAVTTTPSSDGTPAVTETQYLPDPSNPFLNGRWRATQTICGGQAPVAVPNAQDFIFTNGTARLEMSAGGSCGVKPVYRYEVGYESTALTTVRVSSISYDSTTCTPTEIKSTSQTYLTFTAGITGTTLNLIQNNNCDGHGAAYNTQYEYVGAQ